MMILVVALFLFLFQLSMVFAFGNYVHYATFMSARAFLAAGPNEQDQVERAKLVLTRMVKKSEGQAGTDKFPSIAKGFGGNEPTGAEIISLSGPDLLDPDKAWRQGVRYTFKSKIFLLPLSGRNEDTRQGSNRPAGQSDPNSIVLTSESWMGREPSEVECKGAMGDLLGIFDNGC